MNTNDFMARFADARVLIVGDVMLDEYHYGEVRRISPEAPVPVVSVKSSKRIAGGAANVALNAAGLGASVVLIGVAGEDMHADALDATLRSASQSIKNLTLRDPDRRTTVKTRFAVGTQQLLRVDLEDAYAISGTTQSRLIDVLVGEISRCDVVVLSDYGKGVLTDAVLLQAFRSASRLGKPTLVDPKRPDFKAYRGATVIKPNLAELRSATSMACATQLEIDAAVATVSETTGAEVLLTRSERGMSYYATGQPPIHREAPAREVFDVTGAGDTAIAAFATARAAGYDPANAMVFANTAAGVAVSRLGTTVVTAHDIAGAMAPATQRQVRGRVATLERAIEVCREWRGQGLKVGFTNGCFDILHAGHVALLGKSAAACDRLIVAMNSDASVRRLKGPNRPAQNEHSRAQVLASLEAVDLVVPFHEDTPLDLIAALLPDVLIKGADYTQDQVVGGDIVRNSGGRVMLVDLVEGQSTTSTLKRIRAVE
jgi:D-beta-D-heptose 7-phosphate kinase / D-beta-D-heptose 1-phosphate adenosyltransferase